MPPRNPAVSPRHHMALRVNNTPKGSPMPDIDSVSWSHIFAESETSAGHFLAIARCGSFNQAARRFGLRADVLRKGITRLEQRLGSRLFIQKNSVLELTSTGKHLHSLVRNAIGEELQSRAAPALPPMRLAIPPMLLEGALFRSLISWLRKNAGLRVVLQDAYDGESSPADLHVWFATPGEPVLPPIAVGSPLRLSRVYYLPYIAGSYASKRIIPCRLEDLEDYMLVQYQGYRPLAGLKAWNAVIESREHGVTQVQSPEMLRELVRWSGCIGLLMDSTGGQNRNFMPLSGIFREPMALDVWVGVNPASPSLPEAQRIMAMLVQGCATAPE